MENAKFYIAAKGFIFYGDRFLILKKYQYNEPGKWELPGGRLQAGEAPLIALEREVWEEAGLKITVKRLLSTWSYRIDSTEELVGLNFLCNTASDFVSLSKEHTDYRWITASEVNQYDFYQGVTEELHLLDNEGTISTEGQSRAAEKGLPIKKISMIDEFNQVKKWKDITILSILAIIPCLALFNSRFYLLGFVALISVFGFSMYANSKYKCPACDKQLDIRTKDIYCPQCGVQLKEIVEGEE